MLSFESYQLKKVGRSKYIVCIRQLKEDFADFLLKKLKFKA